MDTIENDAINELINAEMYSANLYLLSQCYFEQERLPLLASWSSIQSQQGFNRIILLTQRLFHNGDRLLINRFEQNPNRWKSPAVALNELIGQEKYLTKLIRSLTILVENTNNEFAIFFKSLYTGRISVGDFLREIYSLLEKERAKRLPFMRCNDEFGIDFAF